MNYLRFAYAIVSLTFAIVVYAAPSHSAAKSLTATYANSAATAFPQSRRCGLICVVVYFFRGIGYVLEGIGNFFLGIVRGIGNLLQGLANLARGARTADDASDLTKADEAVRVSKATEAEEVRRAAEADGNDPRAQRGEDGSVGDGETFVRSASEAEVAAEQTRIARDCGAGAMAITAGNAIVFQGCLSETSDVRKDCTNTSYSSSKDVCDITVELSQLSCSVAGSASFFLELGAACYSYSAAR